MLSARHWLIHRPRLLQVAFWLWVAPFVLAAAGVELTHSANCPDNIYFQWAKGAKLHQIEKLSLSQDAPDDDCAACFLTWASHGVLAALALVTLLLALPIAFASGRRSLLSRSLAQTASRGPPALLFA